MVDARIGRLLIASLHQGILDAEPTRVEFYEHWLSPTGLREGRMGVAALNAALSFLRREGQPMYHRVMTGAGRSAADWTIAEVPPLRRTMTARLPMAWRARSAVRAARHLVRATFQDTRLQTRRWQRTGAMGLRASTFCAHRDEGLAPLCLYYAAAVERLFALYEVDAGVTIATCKAAGDTGCALAVTIRGAGHADAIGEAA